MRRFLGFVVVGVLLALLGPVLWAGVHGTYVAWQEERSARQTKMARARSSEWNRQPPSRFPETPEDRQIYPRASFSIFYQGKRGFRIDTAAGTVTQDRIVDPDTTISLHLSVAQLDTLYDMTLTYRMFEMAQPARQEFNSLANGGYLILRAGSVSRSFQWYPASNLVLWTDEHKRMNEFIHHLFRMVQEHPGYRALPPPRGLYID